MNPIEVQCWYDKAIQLMVSGNVSLDVAIEFLAEHGEVVSLRKLVERTDDELLEKVGYWKLKEAAQTLEENAPLATAKLYKAEAVEILGRAKSKAYHYALENLTKVKLLYQANGYGREWDELASMLRIRHKLKSRFIGPFNMIVAGTSQPKKPTFMERINRHLT